MAGWRNCSISGCGMAWLFNYVFFFSSRRRHTRLTCDWSSDVCSSDLVLHQQLRLGVQRRGGFVEDQDRRVLQQRARDGQPLALPAGEPLAALADARLIRVRSEERRVGKECRSGWAPRPGQNKYMHLLI